MTKAAAAAMRFRLMLARACAWSLLVAGWIGIGSFALYLAPSLSAGFALVAMWLFALGAAATVATRGGLRYPILAIALCAGAALTAIGLRWTVSAGGLTALMLAIVGWAALTALASGVVRSLRVVQAAAPKPPVLPASVGALAAALALGDIGDLPLLSMRLTAFVSATAVVLLVLRWGVAERAPRPGCRAGLFDCSLPAWPEGAWRDGLQWPILLAGFAMLPMMASLPLMAAWCSADSVPPQSMVLLHLAAMFGPALLFKQLIARWSLRVLSFVCTALLVTGALMVAWAPSPYDLLGLAVTHGAAWGIAWSGQLWGPERRGRQGTSPLHAAFGYALFTLIFGSIVEQAGTRGVAVVQASLGLVAASVWLAGYAVAGLSRFANARSGTPAKASGGGHDAAG